MKDFFDSLRQQIGDRMSSPIFGSFIISWICWNHRYLFILFSDLPVSDRFTLAENLLYFTRTAYWCRFILFPTGCSLGYILIYPWISRPLLVYWDARQKALAELRNAAMRKTLLTAEESHRIIMDSIEQRTKFEETLARQSREMEVLRKDPINSRLADLAAATDRIKVLENELERERKAATPINPLGHLSQELQKGVRTVVRILADESDQILDKSTLLKRVGGKEITAQVAIDSTVSVHFAQIMNAGTAIVLTERGRAFAVAESLMTDS